MEAVPGCNHLYRRGAVYWFRRRVPKDVAKALGETQWRISLGTKDFDEAIPKIAVTVDLLTTGVDVPKITNLVFLRRVNSRILYEQMLGRATRLCPEIHKETFRIFDAVDLYSRLQELTERAWANSMKACWRRTRPKRSPVRANTSRPGR